MSSSAAELVEYQDRRERIIKLSRDITALSKRLIFLLHRINSRNRESLSAEAQLKAKEIFGLFERVGVELDAVSPDNKWIFKQNYTGGLQEWIEAISFYEYLQEEPKLISLEEVQKKLEPAKVHCSEADYLLGLTDLTGELMRYGMNAIGNAGIEESESVVRQTETWVRQIRAAMSPLSPQVKGLGKKLSVMNQSLVKLEQASYTIALRREEYKDYPEGLKEAIRRINADTSQRSTADHWEGDDNE